MNTKLLLLAISVAAFSSCSTLYKSGQTPDDVYYSPIRTYGEEREERKEVQKDEVKNYNNEDRTIRLGINDRRWRNLDINNGYDPYNYGYSSYNYGSNSYNYGYNSFNYGSYNHGYNPYNYGYYYNPYFVSYPVYLIPSNPKNTTPRIGNLGGYSPVYNNSNTNTRKGSVRPARSYNNSNNGSAVGNVIKKVFTPATNNNSNNYNNTNNSNSTNNSSSGNNRTYSPSNNSSSGSSSSSSSSGSSSSGSGGVSRPPRSGGN